jgi:hypothetical protein
MLPDGSSCVSGIQTALNTPLIELTFVVRRYAHINVTMAANLPRLKLLVARRLRRRPEGRHISGKRVGCITFEFTPGTGAYPAMNCAGS